MTSRLLLPAAAILSAAALSACGSSSSSASGVQLAPSAGATAASATPATTTPTTSTTASTATTAATPTSGPLSKEPTIAALKGAPPKTLTIKDLIVGTGPKASSSSSVTVNYVGALTNGKVFDASWKRNQPFPVTLGQGQVIKGWDQGIPGMKVGGRRELIIPAALAYGPSGQPPTIPPNATLIFIVDMLKAG